MKLRSTLVLTLIFPSLSMAHAYRLVWQNSESVIQNFKDVSKCSTRIWPNFNWNGHTIVSMNQKRQRQVTLDIDSGRVYRTKSEDLPPESSSIFAFFEYDNKKWTSIDEAFSQWEPKPNSVFGLGAHETFHRIAQEKWTFPIGQRGTPLPIQWKPRLYRQMLLRNLQSAFVIRAKQKEFLQHARYWYDRWQLEFPDEVASTTDGYEGTAQYAEIIALMLAQNGCDIDENTLRVRASAGINEELMSTPLEFSMELDGEGYGMGSVAAFILRFDRPIPGWQARVAAGETPVDILLKDITAKVQEADGRLVSSLKKSAASSQDEADKKIRLTRKKLSETGVVLVSLPAEWTPGSMIFDGFFIDSVSQVSYSVIGEPRAVQAEGSKVSIDSGVVSVNGFGTNPCTRESEPFPVSANQITSNGSTYEISSEKIRGSIHGTMKSDLDGTKWLCAGEN